MTPVFVTLFLVQLITMLLLQVGVVHIITTCYCTMYTPLAVQSTVSSPSTPNLPSASSPPSKSES